MPSELLFGFQNLQDVKDSLVTEVGVETIGSAIVETVSQYQSITNEMLDTFVTRTDNFKVNYELGVSATLQAGTQDSTPRPVSGQSKQTISHPIAKGEIAWGGNNVTLAKMTVQKAFNNTLNMLKADANWIRRNFLAAALTETTYTAEDDLYGDLTITPLANGDSMVYLDKQGNYSTYDAYLAQLAAIANATNPFPTIYSNLTKWVDNTSDVVTYVPTSNKASVEGLDDYYPVKDKNLTYGIGNTVLSDSGVAIPLMGGKLIGYVNENWIVEQPFLPSNYLLSWSIGGSPFMAMREFPEASLKGFRPMGMFSPNGNHVQFNFERWAGFNPWNRIGAIVTHIGSATYVNPTNYTAPLAN